MEVMPGDDVETPIWDTYKDIVKKYDDRGADAIGNIERLLSMKKLRKYMLLLQQVKAHFMQILCFKKVLLLISLEKNGNTDCRYLLVNTQRAGGQKRNELR